MWWVTTPIAPDRQAAGVSRRTKLIATMVLVALAVYALTRPGGDTSFRASGSPRPLPPAGALTSMSADEFEGVLVGLQGMPVIVNVWASWCAPCRTETPLLERAWNANRDWLMVVGVDSKDTTGNGRAFMDEFDVTYPNVFDSSGDIRSRLHLRGFPTTYVFDASGMLRTTIVGALTEQRLAAVLADLRP